jgi:hypothetical protein
MHPERREAPPRIASGSEPFVTFVFFVSFVFAVSLAAVGLPYEPGAHGASEDF